MKTFSNIVAIALMGLWAVVKAFVIWWAIFFLLGMLAGLIGRPAFATPVVTQVLFIFMVGWSVSARWSQLAVVYRMLDS